MTSAERQDLKATIERNIRTTEEAIAEYKELTKPVAPDVAIGRISRMDAINNKSVMEAALRSAEEKLKGLLTAAEKIDDPEFGMCTKCRGEIPLGRLKIMPGSTKCVRCS